MNLSQEKQKIVLTTGNILVTANPGTGKTYLLAAKYINLIQNGLSPEKILCLTFTSKAKQEMEERILLFLKEENIDLDISKLNIHTFHSFALEYIDTQEVSSTNMLRFLVFEYIREHDLLNYPDEYLLENIVPSIESNISYLKNYGILPDQINVDEAKKFLVSLKSYSVPDLERFLLAFVEIYKIYESSKKEGTCDYADMLLHFVQSDFPDLFEYVLVDELQDVNKIEAQIALKVAKNFLAVGDKKQAIFGFQGGSIENFELFKDSTHFVLSENRRSTQNILDFAKLQYKSVDANTELAELRNADGTIGEKVFVIESEKKEFAKVLAQIVQSHSGKIAIIARNNSQVAAFSKAFTEYGIEHSSTSKQSSRDARVHVLTFLQGLLSDSVNDVKLALFTPFFPASIQQSFEITKDYKVSFEEINAKIPAFKKMRDTIDSVTSLEKLFLEHLLPIAAQNGREYFLAVVQLQQLLIEAVAHVSSKSLSDIVSYMGAADQDINDSFKEKDIVITTVHKSKGREYDTAIYVPSKARNKQDFVKSIVQAILKSQGIDASIELTEESLRVDFVAYTRARSQLIILTEDSSLYLNAVSSLEKLSPTEITIESSQEKFKRAFALFVAGSLTEAKELLTSDNSWLLPFVTSHFESLEHISYSALTTSPYDYLKRSILKLASSSAALDLGSQVHQWAEITLLDGSHSSEPIWENIVNIHSEILSRGYTVHSAEESVLVSVKDIFGIESSLLFKGKIDAVYVKDGSYLIVDWKSDKNISRASQHRQQLEVYRRIFALKMGISIDLISVAIGYVALRENINDGSVTFFFDEKKPSASAFDTLSKRVFQFFAWKANPALFLEEIFAKEEDEYLWKGLRGL